MRFGARRLPNEYDDSLFVKFHSFSSWAGEGYMADTSTQRSCDRGFIFWVENWKSDLHDSSIC